MLASFSSEEEIPIVEEIPRGLPELACAVTTSNWWSLPFDGSSTAVSGGAGIVLTSPEGHTTAISFQLAFVCTNNIAEYEALIAESLGATKIKVFGDSKLVINQVEGSFSVKEPALAPYRALAR